MKHRSFQARLALLFVLLLFPGREFDDLPEEGAFQVPDLTNSRQLVLVIAPDWDSTAAWMRCYERTDANAPWKEALPQSPVMIGRHGLAWGIGWHGQSPPGAVHVKHEGDGRAPGGAFPLTMVFGYAPMADARITRIAYQPLTASVEGVDDPDSRYYNRVVDAANLTDKDWKSSEMMRREDGVYRWGVIVGHNPQPLPGYGSCIFLHIWHGAGIPTAGCTAMPADFIEGFVRWLDQNSRPVLVQLPADEYSRLQSPWRLP